MSESLLAIGAVAKQAGVSVAALRYYEELELISAACRVGGKRRFDPSIVGRVNFVRRSQGVGLSLEEIRRILDDESGQWRQIIDDKLTELTEQRSRLDSMIELLTEVSRCGCDVVTTCNRTSFS